MTASNAIRPGAGWGFYRGAGVILTAFGLYAVLSIVHMRTVAATIGMEAYLGDGERLPASLLLVSQASKAAALLAAIWLWLARRPSIGWASLGLRPAPPLWLVAGSAIGLAFVPAGLLIVKAVIAVMPAWAGFTGAAFAFADPASLWVSAAYLLMTIAITPFAEEVFFRGFLFQWMTGHRPVWLAALMSSAMFGAMHILPPQAINAALLALVLVWLLRASGSLWPGILAHAVNNAAGLLLGAAAAAGRLPDWLTPPG
ncbi:CPBP family intramembrane metalloprotease [Marinicauda algicola]|uniref:CPBP family intramembrane metalloprotease n=1 Tax=Marinicauda algicola TaxID=2029849 RepID=A0A4S2H4J3_9PROT|nr:CPBP family intramembrane glutamic endopeptidase [Marinicauda algicola]TGY90338.1 CPBP family intramembrane metalloprotease [Marinicauda algicola]